MDLTIVCYTHYMCGRFTIPYEGKDIESMFELSNKVGNFHATYNVSPSETVPVVTKNSPKKALPMRWGFIPSWADPNKFKLKPINARDDKLTGPFYRQALNNFRCIVPSGGYYEWRKFSLDGKTEKQPYYFRLKEGKAFGFGGLYSIHKDAEGRESYTFCIITTKPNKLHEPIHDRMPLVFPLDQIDEWLETDKPLSLVKPLESDLMETWRVPKWVNSAKEDGYKLIEKLPEI